MRRQRWRLPCRAGWRHCPAARPSVVQRSGQSRRGMCAGPLPVPRSRVDARPAPGSRYPQRPRWRSRSGSIPHPGAVARLGSRCRARPRFRVPGPPWSRPPQAGSLRLRRGRCRQCCPSAIAPPKTPGACRPLRSCRGRRPGWRPGARSGPGSVRPSWSSWPACARPVPASRRPGAAAAGPLHHAGGRASRDAAWWRCGHPAPARPGSARAGTMPTTAPASRTWPRPRPRCRTQSPGP